MAMLEVTVPLSFPQERRYILNVLIKDFLGLDFSFYGKKTFEYSITVKGSKNKLIVPDLFFNMDESKWLTSGSLPKLPLRKIQINEPGIKEKLISNEVPIIFGNETRDFVSVQDQDNETSFLLNIDIFGSSFFMLTRYEEAVCKTRDERNRFPASASIAFQENFLERPIVNEYLEIFWFLAKKLWPHLDRIKRKKRVFVSHDVDFPFKYALESIWKKGRNLINLAFFKKKPVQAFKESIRFLLIKFGVLKLDPFNTFNFIINKSDKIKIKSSFYFISGNSAGLIDGNYSLNDKPIRDLIKKIHKRGHYIGLHPTYNSYNDFNCLLNEFKELQKCSEKLGIEQKAWGGRQHYLRWETPVSFRIWNDAGLTYDSTLSFADYPGFRCGTCYEYRTFDVIERKVLRLVERPLIVMECSVLDDRYLGLNIEDGSAFDCISKLIHNCFLFDGDFSILWHNNRLCSNLEVQLYEKILDQLGKVLEKD